MSSSSSYRFAFNAEDFEERVIGAAVKLRLVESNDLDEDEAGDLVELTADQRIEEPRSELGRYLVRHWEALAAIDGESLVYWLRKLVFRGAWLDQRVKLGLLDVDWDEQVAEFGYRDRVATGRSSSSRPCRPGKSCSSGVENRPGGGQYHNNWKMSYDRPRTCQKLTRSSSPPPRARRSNLRDLRQGLPDWRARDGPVPVHG